MNVLSTPSSAGNLNTQQFNDERRSGAFSNGRKVKEPPPQQVENISSQLLNMLASDSPISKKSIIRTPPDRMPETISSRITIMDSGQKLDAQTASKTHVSWRNHVLNQYPNRISLRCWHPTCQKSPQKVQQKCWHPRFIPSNFGCCAPGLLPTDSSSCQIGTIRAW